MFRVEFEPTIPVFERAKTVHALDRAATVIGLRSVGVTVAWCYASMEQNISVNNRIQKRDYTVLYRILFSLYISEHIQNLPVSTI
jgi:hypothetical protein